MTESGDRGSLVTSDGERGKGDPLSTILIVDDDAEVVASLQVALAGRAKQILVSEDATEAQRLLRDRPVDVLLLDHRLEQADGVSLLERASQSARNVTTILMMGPGEDRDVEAAINRGAAAVLDKPFSDEDLDGALERAGSAGSFRGNLSGISLIDMLQVFSLGRRSLVVHIGSDPAARIYFDRGEIVHAERGDSQGEAVLVDVLDTRAGEIRTSTYEAVTRTIDRSFHSLLIDAMRANDEAERDRTNAPALDDDFDLGDLELPSLEPIEEEALGSGLAGVDSETTLPGHLHDPMCQAVCTEVSLAVATALVDLQTGELLGIHNEISFSPDFERFLALYTRSLFRGPDVSFVEDAVRAQRGVQSVPEHYLEQIVLTSRHTHHLAKVLGGGRVALMVVVPRRANVQHTWQQIQALIPGLERNLS